MTYEVLPAVVDPEEAMRPGAPVVHDKDPATARIARPHANVVGEAHGEIGDVDAGFDAGFAEADEVYEETFRTQRVQHASLETHGAVAWIDEDGRLTVRTSSQTPFLTRRALCALPEERVRVVAGRVGGGFGGTPRSVAFNAHWFRVAVDPAPARYASCAVCTRPTRAR